jgi:hypothetical protein
MSLTPKHGQVRQQALHLSLEAANALSDEIARDLATILSFVEHQRGAGDPTMIVQVRQAIHRVFMHLDRESGLVAHVVGDSTPLAASTYEDDAVTSFVLALVKYQGHIPIRFHKTEVGRLVYAALYNMTNIDEVVSPMEAAQYASLNRQRIYELAREGHLFPIYKPEESDKETEDEEETRSAPSFYLIAQIEAVKRDIEERYSNRSRPGPRGPRSKEKQRSA